MAPRTATQFNDQLESLANLTEQDLKDLSVAALRRKLSEAGITAVNRGESTVPVSAARKGELIKDIQALTIERRAVHKFTPEILEATEVDLEDSSITAPTVWVDADEVGEKCFENLKDYTINQQWDSVSQKWLPPSEGRFIFSSQLSLRFATLTRLDNGEPMKVESKLKFRTKAKNKALGMLEGLENEWYYDQLKMNIEAVFKMVQTQMVNEGRQKKENDTVNISTRRNKLNPIDLTPMLRKAHSILLNLNEETPASKWVEVSLALALVTGRRMAEIHSTANFEIVGDYELFFTGQIKTKGKQKSRYELDPGYNIPTLVNTAFVIAAMDWLKANNKRVTTTEAVNTRYSKDLSVAAKKFWAETQEEIFLEDEKRDARKRVCIYKGLRQMYALAAITAFKPENIYWNTYAATILGHGRDDVSTAQRYESDFELAENSISRI